MIAPALLNEAVAAVRTAAVGDAIDGVAPNYEAHALEIVMHRVVEFPTYQWPLLNGYAALWIVREVARQARHEDGCRCGGPCAHGDDMAAEHPAEAAGF